MPKRFEDFEDKPKRGQVQEIVVGKMFSRTYNVPPEALDLIPAKGTIMPGYGAERNETETSDLLKPRVKDVRYGNQMKGGNRQVVVLYYKCDQFGA
jgi:hypothetical protein